MSEQKNIENAHLIKKAQEGDKEAFNQIFRREQRYVFNFMYQLTGDKAKADDLTQEAFIAAYRKISSFRFEAGFRTWLCKIAINLFKVEWRRKPKHVSICLEKIKVTATEDQPERIIIKREMQWCIAHTLQQHVPKKYRMVLVLRDLHHMSYKEIADVLDWNMGRVKTGLHRGRQIFRNHFINGKCRAFAAHDNLCTCEGIKEYEL